MSIVFLEKGVCIDGKDTFSFDVKSWHSIQRTDISIEGVTVGNVSFYSGLYHAHGRSFSHIELAARHLGKLALAKVVEKLLRAHINPFEQRIKDDDAPTIY